MLPRSSVRRVNYYYQAVCLKPVGPLVLEACHFKNRTNSAAKISGMEIVARQKIIPAIKGAYISGPNLTGLMQSEALNANSTETLLRGWKNDDLIVILQKKKVTSRLRTVAE